MKQFRDDYGVFVCSHVFEGIADVLLVVRDPDGYWQFLCGDDHDRETEGPRHVGVGHLTESDPSIHATTALEPGQYAERKSHESEWRFGELDSD